MKSVITEPEIARYMEFLQSKQIAVPDCGIPTKPEELSPALFPFQRDLTAWALGKGRAALFADTGLGKTRMQLEWARVVHEHTRGDVLILAPLAVTAQTVREGREMGIPVTACRSGDDVRPGINITNYERLHLFNSWHFTGVVLDESSILKSYSGATRNQIIAAFAATGYRLACTATPAPNDHMELGNHAEFLGVMSRTEMLALFFVHDGGDTSKWRLKGHAQSDFWAWVASWGASVRKPSDMGYTDDAFNLPELQIVEHCLPRAGNAPDALFALEALTLTEQRHAKRDSLTDRVAKVAEIVGKESGEPWLIWCELNDEGDALTKAIDGAMQLSGADSAERKEEVMTAFTEGRVRVLVTKPSIAGFGMNWQHCARVAFVGVSHSFEQFYQAVRRCWRYGQKRPVQCHLVYGEREGAIVRSIQRKQRDADSMSEEMVRQMKQAGLIEGTGVPIAKAGTRTESGPCFNAHLGDAVEIVAGMASESIDYSIFSPPFASLYTYTDSRQDMGNCKSHAEFYAHFAYLVPELFRVLKTGRLVSFHCMNLPLSKERDGVIGIRDFRGDLIRLFEQAGFVLHSEVVIWKDPVTAMQRTKALGLLYKQLKKDSAMSRQGIPDYLVTMRKPGVNTDPVTKDPADFPCDLWQRYASPVWMDINPSDTLQRESAREEKDERHICPLQLEVIRRAVRLWTNPGDTVLSPFGGIGSEGYASILMGRRAEVVELKESYFAQCIRNLRTAETMRGQTSLLDLIDEPESVAA